MPVRLPPSVLKDKKMLEAYVHKRIFPKLSKVQREYLSNFFTVFFAHGFEGGDFGEDPETGDSWTGGNVDPDFALEVSSIDPHHGTYHAHAYASGSPSSYATAYYFKELGQTVNPIFTRYYVKFKAVPASGYRWLILSVYDKDGYGPISGQVYLYLDNTTDTMRWSLRYRDAGSMNYYSNYDQEIDTDAWYCLELEHYVDSAAGYEHLYVDGVERCGVTGIDNDDRGSPNSVAIPVFYGGGSNHDVYYDCVVVADAYIGLEDVTLKTVTDSFSLSEHVLRNKALILSDSLEATDSFYSNKLLSLNDSTSLSELVTVILGEVTKYITDAVSSSDLASTPFRILRASEAIGATDNAVVNKVLQITETVSLTEVIEVGAGGVKKTRLFLILGDLAVQLTGN